MLVKHIIPRIHIGNLCLYFLLNHKKINVSKMLLITIWYIMVFIISPLVFLIVKLLRNARCHINAVSFAPSKCHPYSSFPRLNRNTTSASFTTASECVTTTTHRFSSCAFCFRISVISAAVSSSKFPVGSSARIIGA